MKDFDVKTPQQLGSVLRGWRKERGLTQQEVGSKVGLAQKAVSQMETDPGRAGVARIFKVMAALDLELVLRPRGATKGRLEW
jgi:HTH-type transcriptional regulator/antitoxin HipB